MNKKLSMLCGLLMIVSLNPCWIHAKEDDYQGFARTEPDVQVSVWRNLQPIVTEDSDKAQLRIILSSNGRQKYFVLKAIVVQGPKTAHESNDWTPVASEDILERGASTGEYHFIGGPKYEVGQGVVVIIHVLKFSNKAELEVERLEFKTTVEAVY